MAGNADRRREAPDPGRPPGAGAYLKRLLPVLVFAFLASSVLQLLFPELPFLVRLLILGALFFGFSLLVERWRSRRRR